MTLALGSILLGEYISNKKAGELCVQKRLGPVLQPGDCYTVFHYYDKISKETKQNKEEELTLALFQML